MAGRLMNALKKTLRDATAPAATYPYECSTRPSDNTIACVPKAQTTAVMFMNLQDAVNRAAAKVGLSDQLPTTGNLGFGTADLAFKVFVKAPQTDHVKAYMQDSRSTDRNYLQQWFASDPMYAIATFDEISGYTRPSITAVPPSLPPAATLPVPSTQPGPVAPGAHAKTFWTKRNVAIAGIGVFVLGLTIFAVSRVRNAAISDYE